MRHTSMIFLCTSFPNGAGLSGSSRPVGNQQRRYCTVARTVLPTTRVCPLHLVSGCHTLGSPVTPLHVHLSGSETQQQQSKWLIRRRSVTFFWHVVGLSILRTWIWNSSTAILALEHVFFPASIWWMRLRGILDSIDDFLMAIGHPLATRFSPRSRRRSAVSPVAVPERRHRQQSFTTHMPPPHSQRLTRELNLVIYIHMPLQFSHSQTILIHSSICLSSIICSYDF